MVDNQDDVRAFATGKRGSSSTLNSQFHLVFILILIHGIEDALGNIPNLIFVFGFFCVRQTVLGVDGLAEGNGVSRLVIGDRPPAGAFSIFYKFLSRLKCLRETVICRIGDTRAHQDGFSVAGDIHLPGFSRRFIAIRRLRFF